MVGKMIAVGGMASVKFFLAPLGAMGTEDSPPLTYLQCVVSLIVGGWIGVSFIYWSSEELMRWLANRREKKNIERRKQGLEPIVKRKFTWINRFSIRVKRRFGLFGLTLVTPAILSIPIGCVICARLYGKNKWTYPSLMLAVVISAFVVAALYYVLGIQNWLR